MPLSYVLRCSPVPAVAASQIRLIRLTVFCEAFTPAFALLTVELHTQAFGYLLRNLLFHFIQIGKSTVIALSPQLCSLSHIDQLGADNECPIALSNPSCKHSLNLQFATDRLRVHSFPSVAEDCASRRHSKPGQLRQ